MTSTEDRSKVGNADEIFQVSFQLLEPGRVTILCPLVFRATSAITPIATAYQQHPKIVII